MKKRILSLLLALTMSFGLLPMNVWAISEEVYVIIENTTYPEAEGAPWEGVLVEEWIPLTEESTMMSCIVEALGEYSQTGAEGNYISEVHGLSAFDGGAMSGWMGTLNDWFTSAGFGDFTVADGTLAGGDEIRLMYTCEGFGEDIGSSWGNNDKTLKDLAISTGSLSPEFDTDTHAYTLTVSADTEAILLTPTATNKNYQVRATVGATEYKRTAEIPVEEGTVITVTCGDPSWPSMNGSSGEAEIYTITVAIEKQEPVQQKTRKSSSANRSAPKEQEVPAPITEGENESISFADVHGHWAKEAIAFAYTNQLMKGVSNEVFLPEATLNHAMLLTILYRLDGEPAVAQGNTVSAVKEGMWYTDAVAWAGENGLVDDEIAPESPVTREQMAKLLFAYTNFKGYAVSEGNDLTAYSDADTIQTGSLEAMQWANATMLLCGRTATTLVPHGEITRAEVATIFMRYLQNIVQ